MFSIKQRIRERGLTALESALALTLLASILGGIALFFNSSLQSSRASESARQIVELREVIRSAFVAKNNYSGFNNNTLRNAGLIPASLFDPNAATNSRMQGAIGRIWNVGRVSSGCAGCNNGFFIQMRPITESQCKDIVVKHSEVSATYLEITNNSRSTIDTFSEPYDLNAMLTSCELRNNHRIRWNFVD